MFGACQIRIGLQGDVKISRVAKITDTCDNKSESKTPSSFKILNIERMV